MAFTKKAINVTFTLTSGQFDNGQTAKTFSGLRVSAKIVNSSGPTLGLLDLQIYGLAMTDMNKLSSIAAKLNLINANQITVTAGDDISGMSTVFQGVIATA